MPRFGPGLLVTAAFIGPGTVTTCLVAGSDAGFALLWALVFATFATAVLQEMAGRLGAGGGLGLGEALLGTVASRPVRLGVAGLLVTALLLGNAAYEGGNLKGGALGVAALFGEGPAASLSPLLFAGLASLAILHGGYGLLERLLVVLVCVMSLAFLLTALLARPDLGSLASGLVPRLPEGSALTVAALLGTTIVPYNLFLHAAAAKRRFEGEGAVRAARADAVLAVTLGGLVSASILVVAASGIEGGLTPKTLASALEPALGPAGRILMGTGLMAAGLTSAITAPMAAGYVLAEIRGGDEGRHRRTFRFAALLVLLAGAAAAASGIRPVGLIVVAQAANGLLLPLVASYLLLVMNRKNLLGDHANGPGANVLGALVVFVSLLLGVRALLLALGVL